MSGKPSIKESVVMQMHNIMAVSMSDLERVKERYEKAMTHATNLAKEVEEIERSQEWLRNEILLVADAISREARERVSKEERAREQAEAVQVPRGTNDDFDVVKPTDYYTGITKYPKKEK